MASLKMPLPPTFDSPEAERAHRKLMLAATFRLFSRFGFDEGVAGHVTARDTVLADHFWVNPFGMHFGSISPDDLLLVNHDGDVVEGEAAVNRAAFAIHSQVHAARPDVVAAAHTHSTFGRAFSSLGKLLDPITQDSCAFFDDTPCSTTTPASSWTPTRASASPTPWARRRPSSCATTAC